LAQYGLADGGPTGEADPATVSGLRLDKYLVTVGRFRQFVNAVYPDGGAALPDAGLAWTPAAGSGKHAHLNGGLGLANNGPEGGYETGWDTGDDSNVAPSDAQLLHDVSCTWTASPGTQENLPINMVNWYEAYAFCIWDGGFLPSEAEWGYAAAGGSQQREYPWGATDPGTANQYAIYDCFYPSSECWAGTVNIAPVGTATLGVGRWGQLDMAGEVWEWILDGYKSPYAGPCADCAYLATTSLRGFRGSAFDAPENSLAAPVRGYDHATDFFDFIGFRCARTP
jgi:formylglycine-generating enzyme required for sulfatase activity